MLAAVLAMRRGAGVETYATMVLEDSPLVFLPLDEQAGATVAIDLSGNGRNGSFAGVTRGQPSMFPSGNGSVRTNYGTVTIPHDAGLSLTGDFTLELTSRLTGPYSSYGSFPKLCAKFTAYSTGYVNYMLQGDKSTGKVLGRVSTVDNNYNDAANTTSSQDEVARTYTLRRSGNVVALFIDGVLKAQINVTGANQTSSSPIQIGGSGSTDGVDQYVQWFSLYNYALSDERIAARIAAR
jgi:carbon monoxide dehydrogenase subunit G